VTKKFHHPKQIVDKVNKFNCTQKDGKREYNRVISGAKKGSSGQRKNQRCCILGNREKGEIRRKTRIPLKGQKKCVVGRSSGQEDQAV